MGRARQKLNPDAEGSIHVLQLMDKTAIRGASIHGVSRLILAWWPEFAGTDVQLSLCVLRGPDAAATVFREAGIEPEYLGRGKFDPRTWFELARIIRRDRIDVLHCHGYGASTFGRLLGLRYGLPVVLHEHFVDANLPVYQRWIDRLLASATTSALAVSGAVREFLTGPRSVPPDRVEILYNSVPQPPADTSTPLPRADVSVSVPPGGAEVPAGTAAGESRRRAESALCPLRVGIVGRLDPIKGHGDFLDAAVLVGQTLPDTEFWIIGDGELSDSLQERAATLNLAAQVRFWGHCDNVPALLRKLDVLVACSHSEGFSLAAAEAMAHGVAVVGTEVGGIPEVVEDGVTGLLVPPHAPQELAEAIVQLLSDAALRQEMGRRGQERCRALFSMETTKDRLLDLYRRLVETR